MCLNCQIDPLHKDFKSVKSYSAPNIAARTLDLFWREVLNFNWERILSQESPTDAFNNFINKFVHVHKKSFSYKDIKKPETKLIVFPTGAMGKTVEHAVPIAHTIANDIFNRAYKWK